MRWAFDGKVVRDRGRETARSLVMRLLMVHTGGLTALGFNIEDHVYGLCALAITGLEFIHQSSHRGPRGLFAKAAQRCFTFRTLLSDRRRPGFDLSGSWGWRGLTADKTERKGE